MPSNELVEVLTAREVRWNRRIAMAAECGQTIVTITLCLPLACRTAPECALLFPKLCEQVRCHLLQGGAVCSAPDYMDGADGPACFLRVQEVAHRVKRLCVETEEQFTGGRMLDVDVMDSHGTPIGRSELELPPRRCFICQQPAAVCVSRRAHPLEEVIRYAQALLTLTTEQKWL